MDYKETYTGHKETHKSDTETQMDYKEKYKGDRHKTITMFVQRYKMMTDTRI